MACQPIGRLDGTPRPALDGLVADLAQWARAMMLEGAPLTLQVPGRAGWELRLVVQGGLRVLDKIDRLRGGVLDRRPALHWYDAPLILWRAATMGMRSVPLAGSVA